MLPPRSCTTTRAQAAAAAVPPQGHCAATRRTLLLALLLLAAKSSGAQAGSSVWSLRADLRPRWAALELGDHEPAAQLLMGQPDRRTESQTLGLQRLTLEWVDIHGRQYRAEFLAGRLYRKVLSTAPLPDRTAGRRRPHQATALQAAGQPASPLQLASTPTTSA